MAIISSHVLDSVTGTHAGGIRVQCFRRTKSGYTEPVFDVEATGEGRISETLAIGGCAAGSEYELVFHSAEYYQRMQLPDDGMQIIHTVVARVTLPYPDEKYHLPVMLAPHSYSIWWSGKPPVNG